MHKRIAAYYKPYKGLLVLDLAVAFLVSLFDLFYPVITGRLIDDYIPNRNMQLILIWLGVLLFLYVLKAAARYIMIFYGHLLGVKIQTDMRRDVFKKLQTLPFTYFDSNKTGAILSRIVTDTFDISEFIHHGPEEIFLCAVMFVGSFVVLSKSSLPLTILLFALIPFIAWVSIKRKRKMKKTFTKMREDTGLLTADLENSIAGIRVSRAFGGEQHDEERFCRGNNQYKASRTESYKAMADYHSVSHFLTDLLFIFGIGATGIFAYYGWISTGDLITFLLYITLFMNSIRRLVDFAEMYEMGMTGYARVAEILDTPTEKECDNATKVTECKGDIRFQDVSFTYENNDMVLSNVNLDIKSGEKVALVGPSGSGKTTLCHLIPRFYEVTGGKILLDGKDISDLQLHSLREQIAIVQQDVFLFNGTIRENIAYGNFDATEEQIMEAARRANIHDYIVEQPEGYNTQVGERGVKLSGGQKQRIAIARAFLKNPPILILDEATSALDNVTERAIQRALDELCKGRTTLVVAHRLSTIRGADKIVVLTENGIEEQGTHEELVAKGGIYATLSATAKQ